MRLEGIHHISAITGDAPGNVDFYTRVMGLRLVAKTVNQDDPDVYHLFYADEKGSPGAELTFFEYPGTPRGRAGSGMVHRIVSRVASTEALDFWERRLAAEGVATERDGRRAAVRRSRGPRPRAGGERRQPGPGGGAPRGPGAVRAAAASWGCAPTPDGPSAAAALLRDLMGAREAADGSLELRGERRGGTIALDPPPAERPLQGAGTVHHVAWGTTVAEHPAGTSG